jgi:gluconolactonase
MKQNSIISFCIGLLAIAGTLVRCTPAAPDWQRVNQELIKQYQLEERSVAAVPFDDLSPNLEANKVVQLQDLELIEMYPGIHARLFYGQYGMGALLELAPEMAIPEGAATVENLLVVMEGDITAKIDGSEKPMMALQRQAPDGVNGGTPRNDLVYLAKGSQAAIRAGKSGAKMLMISPPHPELLAKTGQTIKENISQKAAATVNLNPGQIYDLHEIQFTKLAEGAYSRILSGDQVTVGFVSLDPDMAFPHHNHPEEQLSLVLRGGNIETLLGAEHEMSVGSLTRIPPNMVHSATTGAYGVDVLDIFGPARKDYTDKAKAAKAAFETIIPQDAKLELVIDGKKSKPELNFAEGPKWLNGKLYFSNMYFDKDFNADPKRSSTVEMSPDGSYRNISEGKMQTNGLYPYKNGNLIVCDMMGHRVVEMTTNGQVVRVLADKYDGKPIDGPNDVVTDAKGGFYFTDPQFTMEAEKFQPGRAVYYVSAEGKITRVTEPNEFAMPNGILLTPDGKTLLINNCYDDEDWFPVKSEKDNYIWAYDVQEDGTIKNGRKFAKVLLPGEVLDRKARSSGADGMAMDKEGNIYVATYMGVQIFDRQGSYVGMINLPSFPVSLAFGDADMKTLYVVSFSKVFKIRTNMEGYVNYL